MIADTLGVFRGKAFEDLLWINEILEDFGGSFLSMSNERSLPVTSFAVRRYLRPPPVFFACGT